ncbi:MAG: glycosyltransferase [Pseudomonadota bacterium]
MAKTILQIAPTPFFSDRGCHIRVEGIIRCLDELGFRNRLCTYHHGRDIDGVDTVRISPIANYTQTEAGPNKYKLWADWKLLWLAVVQTRKLKPDVIHAHLHEGVMIGLAVKLLFFWRRIPLLADMQGSLTGELDTHGSFNKLPLLRWPTRLLERFLMWAADYIVCSSEHSLALISREFSVPTEKISLAQDGADPVAPGEPESRQQLRASLNIAQDKTLVMYTGALLESKGLNELKSLLRACADQPDLHFLIIGYPTDNLQPFLQEHGLESSATLTGRVQFEALPSYLNAADIAIDPKFSDAGEGSGKMLNYLAAGLPVVAFANENNRVFLPDDSKLAGNVEEMAQLLSELAKDHNYRQERGEANRQHFTQHFSWQTTRTQLANAYTSLIGADAMPGRQGND